MQALAESNIELKKTLRQLQQKLQVGHTQHSSLSLVQQFSASKDLQTGGQKRVSFKDSHYPDTRQEILTSRTVTRQADTKPVSMYRGAHIASHSNHGQSDVKYPLQDIHSSYTKQPEETLEVSQSLSIESSFNPQVTGVCHSSGHESFFVQPQSHTTFNHNPHSPQFQNTTNPAGYYKSPQQTNHPQHETDQATSISYAQVYVPDIEAHLYVNLLEDDTSGNKTPPGPVQNAMESKQHLCVHVPNPDKRELVIENEASICDGCSERDITLEEDDTEDTHYMNLPHKDDGGQYMNLPPKP